MSDDERLARLEQRVAVLEGLVRRLAREGTASPDAPAPPAEREAERVPTSPVPAAEPVAPAPEGTPAAAPAGAPAWTPWTDRPAWRAPAGADAEAWLGQRGLLAVGVLALLLAAGYLLKLSFERGWISPLVRCVGGVVAGAVTGGLGWRLVARYRTYGAALVGCGAGMVYLAVWAATRLYHFLPPPTGIAGLALVSACLAALALALGTQALGATAVAGALVAPVLLGRDQANATALLLYLASMGAGFGLVAARGRWRFTALLLAAGLALLGVGAAPRAQWAVALGYGILLGAGGLALGLRQRWFETRFFSFWSGWGIVAAGGSRAPAHWPLLAAGLALAAPVWRFGFREDRPAAAWRARGWGGWSLGEWLYFLATPLLLAWALHEQAPAWFDARPGLVALAVALPYLAAGWRAERPAFALVGAAALGWAAWDAWDGSSATWATTALAIVWAAGARFRARADAAWFALATYVATLARLAAAVPLERGEAPAFTGAPALAMWGAVAGGVALAWLARPDDGLRGPRARFTALYLALALTVLFLGVTLEFDRLFPQRLASPEAARLASGLSISAWWIAFAAALVLAGFRRALPGLRKAGLAVAAVAVAKVLVSDLSSLDALYRVGSVLILGVVSLALAWMYHRHARAEAGRAP